MPYGKLQHFLTVRGKTKVVRNDEEKEVFDWQNALADAGIMAGVTFFTTMVGINLAGIHEAINGCVAAGIAAGLQFFTILALKRGLKTSSGA